jgi:hypothetical protein
MIKSKSMIYGIIMAALLSGSAYAANEANEKDKRKGCCGDVPVPFSSNQKVELANGEYYTLVGRVIFFQNHPFLNVDLDVHPWLANSKAVQSGEKIYPLQGSPAYWKTYESLRVKINVQAAADLVDACSNAPLYIISLDLVGTPEVVPNNAKRKPGRAQE